VSRRATAWAYAALGVAFVATRATLIWRFPPHSDEAIFEKWTLAMSQDLDEAFIPLTFGQHPLQEWLALGPARLGLEPLTSLRLVTIVAGLVTMGAVAWLARELAGPWAGLAAAAVWLVVPFGLVYGVIGLADPLVAALAAVAMGLQLSLARRPRLAVALVLGLVLGVGILVKLTMLTAVWLVPLGLLLVDWRREGLGGRLARWAALLLLAGVIAFAMYQVLRLSVHWEELQASQKGAARHGVLDFLEHPGRWIEHNWPSFRQALRGYLTVPLVLAAAVGAGLTLRRTPRLGLYVLGWAVLPLAAVVALADTPYVRWVLVAVPALVVLAGVGVAIVVRAVLGLVESARRPLVWATCAALALVLAAPGVAWDVRTIRDPTTRPYPGNDEVDYVEAYSAGGPWLELVPRFRRIPGPVRVATLGSGLEHLEVSLRGHVVLVPVGTAAPEAVLALQNTEDPLPRPAVPFAWQPVERIERPRDGTPVTLSRRVVRVGSQLAADPSALRRILGSQAATARFATRYPAVARWIAAWNEAYRPS
jgi:4-amino-4-deoxy-L-arabinose transferase-like glycosyltransferase